MQKLIDKIKSIPKGYFSLVDLRKISDLNDASLKVALSRLKKDGQIKALIRGYYALDLSKIDYEKLAIEIYKPSYLSFEWVLGKYNILSQKAYNLTLATTKRAKVIELGKLKSMKKTSTSTDQLLIYHHLNPDLFWGYNNVAGIHEAEPEKAFLDLAYLSLNGYAKFDPEEMDLKLLDKKKLRKYLKEFNSKKLRGLVNTVL